MKRKEITFYALTLIALNLPLLTGRVSESLIFLPEKVMQWQVYRLITHAFVHVSWYHLLLDGSAFLMLYRQTAAKKLWSRTAYVFGGAAGSIIAACLVLPYSNSTGYCGLSGIAHGLMAVCGLEMIFDSQNGRSDRIAGVIWLLIVVSKSIFEAINGTMLLEYFHFSMMGSPVTVSHLGGVIGAVIIFGITRLNYICVHKMNTPYTFKAKEVCKKDICPCTQHR